MIKLLLSIRGFCHAKNRWWLALATGLSFALCLPPFTGDTHVLLTLFPLLSFVILLPLFAFASVPALGRAVLYTSCYGVVAALVQFYWISLVTAEGVWPLILTGVALMGLLFGGMYLALGLLFRWSRRMFPRAYPLVFPAAWVLVEFLRTLGDLSFPWMLIGYALTPLPVSQAASVCGVFGLSFLIVMGNCLAWMALSRLAGGRMSRGLKRTVVAFSAAVALIAAAGLARLGLTHPSGPEIRVSCIQANLDQLHWGNHSIDTSFDIVEGMMRAAAVERPDLIVTAESALLCYLVRQPQLRHRIMGVSADLRIPMIVGALHWDPAPKGQTYYDYLVYNTAFFMDTGNKPLQPYFKMKLVPFSEVLPFEGVFPILSRVNLGEADFKAGKDPVTFGIGADIRAVPLICYEIIYPDYVRRRLSRGGNLLVNITNDGWFGRSSGPYQHAMMARLRCIENGVGLVRCANSGISMIVDQLGRMKKATSIYTRTVLTGRVSLVPVFTVYSRIGDWPVWMSFAVVAGALLWTAASKIGRRSRG